MTTQDSNTTSASVDQPTTPEQLLERKVQIEKRLEEIGANDAPVATSTALKRSNATTTTKRKGTTTTTTTTGATTRNSNNTVVAHNTDDNDTDVLDTANSTNPNNNNNNNPVLIPYTPKTIDVHWDFVMKEMMWLGADFQGERKRQVSLAKKLASSMRQYHKTKETRRIRELHQAEMKRRKLAAKMARDVKSWWTKIEKVIAYKQKLEADEERKSAMNKQLVVLVQQTEKYTESLSHNAISEDDDDEYDDDDDDVYDEYGDNSEYDTTSNDGNSENGRSNGTESETGNGGGGSEMDTDAATSESDGADLRKRRSSKRQKRPRRRHRMTIEEVLATAEHKMVRKSKRRIIDYSRMRLESKEFYGESTASDASGSDGSYSPDEQGSNTDGDNDNDDDSTLQQAIQEELMERHQQGVTTFLADPEELRKLREEVDMDVDLILERLQQEGQQQQQQQADDTPMDMVDETTKTSDKIEKRVHFANAEQSPSKNNNDATETEVSLPLGAPENANPKADANNKYDADDDGDASDVEDYNDGGADDDDDDDEGPNQKSDEEYEACEPEADDETTMAQEEALPQEISAEDEIALLQKENEMSIEELRALYANMENKEDANTTIGTGGSGEDDTDNEESNKADGNESEQSVDARTDKETSASAKGPDRLGKNQGEGKVPNQEPANESAADELDDDADEAGSEEYEFNENELVDDETTMEAEERLGRDMTYEEEISLLQRESEMSIEELREKYAALANDNGNTGESDDVSAGEDLDEDGNDNGDPEDSNVAVNKGIDIAKGQVPDEAPSKESATGELDDDTDEAGNEEYEFNENELVDDETTMEAEERLGRDMTYEEEISLLQRESEMSIEELRAKYAALADDNGNTGESDDVSASEDLDEDEDNEEGEDNGNPEDSNLAVNEDMDVGDNKATVSHDDQSSLLKRKREADGSMVESKKAKVEESGLSNEDGLAAMSALEASAEKAQQTLATRPFLLAPWVKLRRYQQVGLNWLVSLQSRRLNGILADEMGLGKTLQTISLLSYLASYKGIWGPHLIVVPTSVIINWETELKRFCPALKVLCYYGSAKRRKELRQGWTKTNWYHVVITSYQLAVQDAFAFKRKKWYYLVLDEAQNIKNFQSQRWQTLINFNTQRRLLLSGTPLQNSLMELWSLLHFLMPYIFRSRKEFSYWFSNPMNSIIEGNSDANNDVIKRLHGIIRPFILRRLKKDVETQMPGKYEHIVKCQLSRRQMTLYEEFMSRSSTRQALKQGGNFMGMMNVLMQLRKVCNHPDLFEPRSVVTPFVLPGISYTVPAFICSTTSSSPLSRLSRGLIQPMWCGSGGLPSTENALRHDQIESDELKSLIATLSMSSLTVPQADGDENCPDELKELVQEVYRLRLERKKANIEFQNRLNKGRCHVPPFPYSQRLLSAMEVEYSVFQRTEPVELKEKNVLLTPECLLKMRKTEQQRSEVMEDMVDRFVFCVPPAGAHAPVLDSGTSRSSVLPNKSLNEMLLEPVEELMKPYRKAHARLSSFFPDKKLIQFDAGKLQTLAQLLRNLKQGGHRALIFTQMSKMLDILEAFLNINGLTYLRLDGATGVDRRQRYMDRFNNDTKIFCFILSTRSGGMGINLTGADTVIFYDSDWNPAMDAQAQDRAHRIGQTRDVHIYRLITEHTIEENILLKAKQKKNLDIVIMDKGKFDASHQVRDSTSESSPDENDIKDVYTKGGLRAILGVSDDVADDEKLITESTGDASNMSKEQMEMAMASLEDEDDVQALKGAQQEAAEELKEFDENAEIKADSDAEDGDDGALEESDAAPPKKKKQKKTKSEEPAKEKEENGENKNEVSELEKEFAAWQTSVGFDAAAIESSLSPMERYGLQFREKIDPFYSIFYFNELQRKNEATELQEEVDIEEVERQKAREERQAIDDGDLLATCPRPESLIRQRNLYRRERARLRSNKMRRKLTGENWIQKIDGLTKHPFWYNEDTGEAVWDKPSTLLELEAIELAHKQGWGYLPPKVLVKVMHFLIPYPERQNSGLTCKQWKHAAHDIGFVRHVYPVEMGALGQDPSRRDHNHFSSIDEALSGALPGDTIELSDGHYWVSDAGLSFTKPLKLIGDEYNPSNVVIELSGSVSWTGHGGLIEGVTLRRPKLSSGEPSSWPILKIENKGRVDVVDSIFDNEGSFGSVVVASGTGSKGRWNNVIIRNGGANGIEISGEEVVLKLSKSAVRANKGNGVQCSNKAKFGLLDCDVNNNGGFGMVLSSAGTGEIVKSRFNGNVSGVVQRETGCTIMCSMNTALVTTQPSRGIPGFRITTIGQEATQAPPKPSILQVDVTEDSTTEPHI